MPAIVKVKVIEAKELPIMDRASDLTDAFVEIRLGSLTYKTDVYRKSLNPLWDSEWFKFEVDDEEIQEEYLQLKVLDYDVYSSHDAIGKVNINLDLLTTKDGTNELGGFFPIYDTLHGIRGYIKIKVRVQFFSDTNKYRQTSCGIQFFSSSGVPSGYTTSCIHGLVDELLVDDDPEYQWIDKIRTPRASNEARQRLFTKLAGEVKRKIGLQVLELGGNAVIGYQQNFDLEGETGIVIRAIGTSVTIVQENDLNPLHPPVAMQPSPDIHHEHGRQFFDVQIIPNIVGRSRHGTSLSVDLDQKDKLLGESPDSNKANFQRLKTVVDEQEYPFFTFTTPPPDFVLHLGGIVSSRSVKLLDKINNPDEPETRDSWWKEIRNEIKSHAKAMGCHAVLGYKEYTTICDDLIVLSACGTAAVLQMESNMEDQVYPEIHESCVNKDIEDVNPDEMKIKDTISPVKKHILYQAEYNTSSLNSTPEVQSSTLPSCHLCHVPYQDVDLPLPVTLSRCMFCRQDKVPDILFTTIDIPDELPVTGSGCMVQARVIRSKKKEKDEINAENVSQILPFLEFDLHQQLINKLKIKGMNAIFGMQTILSIGDQAIIGVMTGTAVYLTALPQPPMLFISGRKDTDSGERDNLAIADIQKKLIETTKKNQQFYNIKDNYDILLDSRVRKCSDECESGHHDVKNGKLDLCVDGRDTYILEIDDQSDTNILPLLSDTNHEGFAIFNTQATPGFPLLKQEYQYFSIFNRVQIPMQGEENIKISQWLSNICENLVMGIRLKTRGMMPCCLTRTSFDVEIDDDDYLQVTINACAVKTEDSFNKPLQKKRSVRSLTSSHSSHDNSFCRNSNATQISKTSDEVNMFIESPQAFVQKKGRPEPKQPFHSSVTICPMDYVPNAQIVSYLGNINLFLIRESSAVKEDGGLNLFMQQFVSEVHAIIRAHVIALGGNAILSFYLNEIVLNYNPHKNQAQCLINVSGDTANVKRSTDEMETIFCQVEDDSNCSSISSSPATPQAPELIEEIKYKLDRAVFGTNV
ncbi:C2 domain-containing protein 5-like isoform X2 [Hydractinia symbiolongicarpus]|uniref:C2 domain-containing protein 5-like isoform X2 n=1 Tax=Hydractinia symbiolongicarpus TaxID=13093 RepID=UPI00254CFC59|nr:C2 domain-containing protein 5-like isoform X2 [Hydractinia symbiolongicarpus]